ncbi:MAG: ribosomal methyltransferase [Solirubrobacterales bacterium]|nr:ribosomal methyltransferase [Solirubrobacterales bacterium]
MRRLELRVRAQDLDAAYDALLPLLPDGLHPRHAGDHVVLVALADALPPRDVVFGAVGQLLLGDVAETDAGADLARALTMLTPAVVVDGRVQLRMAGHAAAAPGVIDVVLARGAGFGIGTHATTRHCLALLLDLPVRGSFADLGCGAGALAIVAWHLGYAPVVGVDLLEDVTVQARDNVAANGVEADIVTGDLLAMDRLDVEVAAVNVSLLDVHLHLAALPLAHLQALVVSGLRDRDELAQALASYAQAGLRETRRLDAEDWPAVLLER